MKKRQNKKLCLHCRGYFDREDGKQLPVGFFCSIDHVTEYITIKQAAARARQLARANKAKEESAKADRRKHRERKEALKTVGDYIKEAQASFNTFVRTRDYGKPCVSCGSLPANKFGGSMDCGHYRSRGAAGHLRFNLFNVASQCVKCNRYGSGSAVDYRIELIKRIGLERVERIECDNKTRGFTKEYLQRIKKIFNRRTRLYKKLFRCID